MHSYGNISSLFFETFLTVIYTKTTKPVHARQGHVAPIKYTINQGKQFEMTNLSPQWPATWGGKGRLIRKQGGEKEKKQKSPFPPIYSHEKREKKRFEKFGKLRRKSIP